MGDVPMSVDLARMPVEQGLLSRCRAGDQAAWRELVATYERLVYSVPRSYGFGAEDAADVTQATFLSLLQGIGSIREDEAIIGWLGTVARRHTWRMVERRRREREELAQQTAEREGATDALPDHNPYDAWVERAWLAQGLAGLDARCRELLTALYLDDSSYQTVAARLGLAVGTIGPTRNRCLNRLRALMENQP